MSIESSGQAKGFRSGAASNQTRVISSSVETIPKNLAEHAVATPTRQAADVAKVPRALDTPIDQTAKIVRHESSRTGILTAKPEAVPRNSEQSAPNDSRQELSRDETLPNEPDETRKGGCVAPAAVARNPRVEFTNSGPRPLVRAPVGEDPPLPPLLKRPPRITREPLQTTKPALRTGHEAYSVFPEARRSFQAFSPQQNTNSKAATQSAGLERDSRITSSVKSRGTSPSVLQQAAPPGTRSPEPAIGIRAPFAPQFVAEKKLDGPRLSIGHIEVQIINENSPAPESRQRVAPEFSVDEWEQSERRHIRVLGVS
jgi:hypothetical protein